MNLQIKKPKFWTLSSRFHTLFILRPSLGPHRCHGALPPHRQAPAPPLLMVSSIGKPVEFNFANPPPPRRVCCANPPRICSKSFPPLCFPCVVHETQSFLPPSLRMSHKIVGFFSVGLLILILKNWSGKIFKNDTFWVKK